MLLIGTHRHTARWLVAAILCAAPLQAQATDEGTMIPRRTLAAGIVATHEQWDRYWEGTLLRGNDNIGTLATRGATIVAGYGVTDRLSVAAKLPYLHTRASGGTLHEMRGVQDVTVAARYRLLAAPLAGGEASAVAAASVGIPAGGYSPDFLPLSIGDASRRISARGTVAFRARGGWLLNASAAHSWRGKVKLDRDAYYTGGRLHLGNEVALPDVFEYTLGTGYRGGRIHLPLSVTRRRTLGGGDIRRQEMPFIANRMDFVRLDAGAGYALPGTRLTLSAGGGRVLRGRNVGQATTFSAGLQYTLPL
jgi:hypothetical protein